MGQQIIGSESQCSIDIVLFFTSVYEINFSSGSYNEYKFLMPGTEETCLFSV